MKVFNNMKVQNVMKAYGKNVAKTEKKDGIKMASDKIEISEQAKDFQVAMKSFNELPEVRQEKIDELKAQIESGNYKPSAEDIAKKMLGKY